MLVLTRKTGEKIMIEAPNGEGGTEVIEVVAKEIRRNQVRIGIDASEDIPVHREEVYEEIQEEEE